MNQPLEKSDGGLPSSALLPTPTMVMEERTRTRLSDYCELAKVRLSLLVLLVTAAGYCLGSQGAVLLSGLIHTIVGTALVAFAANAVNQYIERDFDRLMPRTADRPLPSGRMTPHEALTFATICLVAGSGYLALLCNLLAMALALITFALYITAYTPLKRKTACNTLVGAVPGALPPVIGFAAANGQLDTVAAILFAILFTWQIPHFYAIDWLYRNDYARGGFRMLSAYDPTGRATGVQTILFTLLLFAASMLPAAAGLADGRYVTGAVFIGFALLAVAARFSRKRSRPTARSMLLATIAYLPLLMMLMLFNHLRG